MKLDSHYIFLPKDTPNKKSSYTKGDGTIVLNLPTGVGGYISKTFSITSTSRDMSIFKRVYNAKINLSDIEYHVVFSQFDVGKNVYLDIIVEEKTKYKIVKCLEYIQEKLLNSGIEDDYIAVISYDVISEYYCNKIYPKLNSLERKLRRLLYNTYIVIFDQKYYEQTILGEIQSKAKKIIGKKGNKKAIEERRNKEFFYSLDFGDIQRFLFTATWIDYDEKQKQKFLDEHPDLTLLSDEELRERFSEFSPKSDWERFFKNKVDDTIKVEEIIDTVREFRNQIAHCKHFSADDYKECAKAIKELSQAIDQAIIVTEEKDFENKNRELLHASFANLKNTFSEITKSITESFRSLIELQKSFQIANPFKEMIDSIKKSVSQIALSDSDIENQPIDEDDMDDDDYDIAEEETN